MLLLRADTVMQCHCWMLPQLPLLLLLLLLLGLLWRPLLLPLLLVLRSQSMLLSWLMALWAAAGRQQQCLRAHRLLRQRLPHGARS
jgi:hypothetical protein